MRGSDRALLVWMTRLWPSLLGAAQVVQPETILRWHRAGFKVFWRWKSRTRAGRPKIDRGLRDLIRRMSGENPKWGASRIHGELLMLGFEVAQSTVSKYMGQDGPPSQSWKTFLRNHAQAIVAIDLCVVPTLTFERLFAFLVLGHVRQVLMAYNSQNSGNHFVDCELLHIDPIRQCTHRSVAGADLLEPTKSAAQCRPAKGTRDVQARDHSPR